MATLTTKFDMGQTVWHANITTERRRHPCPDCLGSKVWTATSPAGATFEVACPRCSASYQSNCDLSLDYSWRVPSARKLTIGKINASTATGDDYDAGNRYMCAETGIGSGSIYNEDTLFETEAEALAAGQIKADAENANAEGWVAKQYDASVKFSDYELKDAQIKSEWAGAYNVKASAHRLAEAIEDIAETNSDVREALEAWREAEQSA